MPLISIETNQALSSQETLEEVSQFLASLLDKPESYVMLKYTHNANMLFAGSNEPLAHVTVKSLGLPETMTAQYSALLCDAMKEYFSVPSERVYIEFVSPERHMWGWDRSTF